MAKGRGGRDMIWQILGISKVNICAGLHVPELLLCVHAYRRSNEHVKNAIVPDSFLTVTKTQVHEVCMCSPQIHRMAALTGMVKNCHIVKAHLADLSKTKEFCYTSTEKEDNKEEEGEEEDKEEDKEVKSLLLLFIILMAGVHSLGHGYKALVLCKKQT